MTDRDSTYPGRVKLTPVSGQTNIYDMERADEPKNGKVGTGLVKVNLLSDEAATSLGLDPKDDPTLSDAFLQISSLITSGGGGGSGGGTAGTSIGDIIFSYVEPSPDGDWLQCNGTSKNTKDYPELASYLATAGLSGPSFNIIANENIGYRLSNGVIYEGYFWIYSHDYNGQNLLYGYSLSDGENKTITIHSTSDSFNRLANLYGKPITLSIYYGKIFITQIRSDSATANTRNTAMTLLSGDFTGTEKSIAVSDVFPNYTPAIGAINGATGNVIPYVAAVNDYYYMCTGPDVNSGRTVHYIRWQPGDTSPESLTVHYDRDGDGASVVTNGLGKLAFNLKNEGEMIVSKCLLTENLSAPVTTSLQSVQNELYSDKSGLYHAAKDGVFGTNGTFTKNMSKNSNITPIACNEDIILVDANKNGGITYFAVNDSGIVDCFAISEEAVPDFGYAKWFPDAAAYFPGKNVTLIFIGTGFIFTKDVSDASEYGYYDSSSQIGIISSCGNVVLDPDNYSMFYVCGYTSDNKLVVASCDSEDFSAGTSKFYLPHKYLNGMPGWIRAKVTDGGD